MPAECDFTSMAASSTATAAAAVGALLSLLQHTPVQAPRYSHPEQLASQLSNNPSCCCAQTHRCACQQQQQQQQQQQKNLPDIQQHLAAHMQSCLLASFCRPLQLSQEHMLLFGSQTLQQPWQQLWPSQLRAFSNYQQQQQQQHQQQRCFASSPPVRGSSSSSSAAWRSAVPPLHQPNKHVTGTNPLKARPLEAAATAVSDAAAAEAVGDQLTSQAAAESALARFRTSVEAFYGRHRVVLISTWLFCTSLGAVLIILQAAFFSGTPGLLCSQNVVLQKNALRDLRRALNFRALYGESLVQKMSQAGILTALVRTLQPGTDAVVLIQACEVIKSLLDSPTALNVFKQAGLVQSLEDALREGWVPTGALKPMTFLLRRLS